MINLGRTEKERGTPTMHRVARAAGGFLHHAVPFGETKSLCGHEPNDNPRSTMTRACWNILRVGHLVTCRKCQAEEKALLLKGLNNEK
jgi:hypothetical protein